MTHNTAILGTTIGTVLGAVSEHFNMVIQLRVYLTAWVDSIYLQTLVLALIGGIGGYIGAKIIEAIHKWGKKRFRL